MPDRFALIDINSGYVWGVIDAVGPLHACQMIDYDLGERHRTYVLHGADSGAHHWGVSGYLVHRVPTDFDVENGQDADEIAAVEANPRVAIVQTMAVED